MEPTAEAIREGLIVVRVLSAVLDRLVQANIQTARIDPGSVTKFHAMKTPGISIQQYLERIHKYASCSNECFILALIYIDRLIQRSNFLLTELNVHRVVITSVLLAAKYFDDAYYNNAYYAKVGGVVASELNGLEVDFLFRINFSLRVTPDVYEKYRAELVWNSNSVAMPPPLSPEHESAHMLSLAPPPPPPPPPPSSSTPTSSLHSPGVVSTSSLYYPESQHKADNNIVSHVTDAVTDELLRTPPVEATETLASACQKDTEVSDAVFFDNSLWINPAASNPIFSSVVNISDDMSSLMDSSSHLIGSCPMFTGVPKHLGMPIDASTSPSYPTQHPFVRHHPIHNNLNHHQMHNLHHCVYHHPRHRQVSSDSTSFSTQNLVGRMLAGTVSGL